MAIKAKAGFSNLYMRNTDRAQATIPIKFPSIKLDPAEDFSWSVWVRPTSPNIPITLTIHSHLDGSQVDIIHNGQTWLYTGRNAATGLPSMPIKEVTFNAWQVICFVKQSNFVNIYMGVENLNQPSPWTVPIQLEYRLQQDNPINADLDYFRLLCNAWTAIAGFKMWNHALSQAEMQSQCQEWHGNPTVGPRPFWVSPLRVPGDVSNVQDPYTGQNLTWEHGHAYSSIDTTSSGGGAGVANLVTVADPAYMANSSLCNAWIYPTFFPNMFVDPGTAPVVPTFYKVPIDQFIQFQDLGSIATEDFQIVSIDYYGAAFGGVDPGLGFTECWGLYRDEGGVEIDNMTDPAYRFVPGDTGVVIPPGPIKGSTMYVWKFGAKFKYPIGSGETNTAHFAYAKLYVTYQGYPTGVPRLHEDFLTGLFIINRDGTALDRYNHGVELKIPDPTVRTAYIGE